MMPPMRVTHLNCATMCPPLAAALNRAGKMIAHCLLIESNDGYILVDTGLGQADCETPRARVGLQFLLLVGPQLDRAETAIEQVVARGIDPRDIRHIVLTHLDVDHAGGLSDFPEATVHVLERERVTATGPLPWRHRERYRKSQIAHGPRWRDYAADGERWFGFEAVRAVEGVGVEILFVPLPGHTLGHAGVAVRDGDRWLLHAGDAYFHAREKAGKRASFGLELFQRLMAMDGGLRLHNRDRLSELHGSGSVEMFCAHDPDEYERLAR
jgi:glyoxylase-like metal-dependent hydrolase (beta-lactamase superfamily II)